MQDPARRGSPVLSAEVRHGEMECRPERDAPQMGPWLVRGLRADAAGLAAAARAGDPPPAIVEALWEAPVATGAGSAGWLPDLAAPAAAGAATPADEMTLDRRWARRRASPSRP